VVPEEQTRHLTEGGTWEQLRDNVREAVSAYFFDQSKPAGVRLHLVRDEVLTVEKEDILRRLKP
jgi:hypothetical protein